MDVLQLQSEMVHPSNPKQTPYAPSTTNRVLALLKTMGGYAVRWEILETVAPDRKGTGANSDPGLAVQLLKSLCQTKQGAMD